MPGNENIQRYEREVTAAERFFRHSPFAIVTMILRIKGLVSEEMLRGAVTKVQRRHALLRVRMETRAEGALRFTSEGAGEIAIETVPRESEGDWIGIHAQAAQLPFEFETRPAIRFVLVHAPDRSDLIILCHHIICDGMSLAYLARDLMLHLGEPGREVEVLPAPPPIDLDNLPGDVSQPGLVKFLIGRMNRKWAKGAVTFDQADYEALTEAYWANYHHELLSVELSEAETASLVARCRKEAVTVNTALTAAFSGAQGLVQGPQPYQARTVIAADLRDRLPHSPGEGIGMYAGGVELELEYDQRRGFWENARRFHKKVVPAFTNKNMFGAIVNWLYLDPTISEAMSFKKLGGLVPAGASCHDKLAAFAGRDDVVLRLLKRDNLETPESKYWGTAVTNLGRLDFPTAYGSLELERLIMQPGGGIPLANANLVLGAVTCAGRLSLIVEYAREAVDADTMWQIKDKAMAHLLEN
jgi:NRPS condensation-like uncharacterized protein